MVVSIYFFRVFHLFVVQVIEPATSHMLLKCPTTELPPSLCILRQRLIKLPRLALNLLVILLLRPPEELALDACATRFHY